jgi:hypothetical protein
MIYCKSCADINGLSGAWVAFYDRCQACEQRDMCSRYDADTKPVVEKMSEWVDPKLGVVRIERWPEGIVVWVGGEIRWKSWADLRGYTVICNATNNDADDVLNN